MQIKQPLEMNFQINEKLLHHPIPPRQLKTPANSKGPKLQVHRDSRFHRKSWGSRVRCNFPRPYFTFTSKTAGDGARLKLPAGFGGHRVGSPTRARPTRSPLLTNLGLGRLPGPLREMPFQLLHHRLRLRELEFARWPLFNSGPEFRTCEGPCTRGARDPAPWPGPAQPSPPQPTHRCRPRVAESPQNYPSAAAPGSPPPPVAGPPRAAPGSGGRPGARTRVSWCCGYRAGFSAGPGGRGWWGPGMGTEGWGSRTEGTGTRSRGRGGHVWESGEWGAGTGTRSRGRRNGS